MRTALLSLVFVSTGLFQASQALGEDLPKHNYQQEVKFAAVPMGKSFRLNGKISLPLEQAGKLSEPSGITVYEKSGKDWIRTAALPFSGYDGKLKQLLYNGDLKLTYPDQPFALHFTAVHCHETGRGLCVIDHFQGVVDRNPKAKNDKLEFSLIASDPKTYNQ